MIVDGFIGIIYLIVLGLSRIFVVFGDVTPSTYIVSSITTANTYLSPLSFILHTPSIILIIGFSVVFELSYLGYKGVNWIIRKIPTIS
jgi:uncharacterized membrane protein YkgB